MLPDIEKIMFPLRTADMWTIIQNQIITNDRLKNFDESLNKCYFGKNLSNALMMSCKVVVIAGMV